MAELELEIQRIKKAQQKISNARARIKANEEKNKAKRQKEVETELKRTGIEYNAAYDRFIHWLRQQPNQKVLPQKN